MILKLMILKLALKLVLKLILKLVLKLFGVLVVERSKRKNGSKRSKGKKANVATLPCGLYSWFWFHHTFCCTFRQCTLSLMKDLCKWQLRNVLLSSYSYWRKRYIMTFLCFSAIAVDASSRLKLHPVNLEMTRPVAAAFLAWRTMGAGPGALAPRAWLRPSTKLTAGLPTSSIYSVCFLLKNNWFA